MEGDPRQIVFTEFQSLIEGKLGIYLEPQDDSDFLASYSLDEVVELARQSIASEEDIISANILLSGSDVHLSLSIFLPLRLIFRLSSVEASNAMDWGAEVANLIMGGLKNRLSLYQVKSRLGLPKAEYGIETAFLGQFKDSCSYLISFASKDKLVIVLEYETDPSARWSRDLTKELKREGELMMF